MKKTVVMQYVGALNDGGAETLLKDYALLLDKEKFDVFVCVHHINPDTANYQALSAAGIRVRTIFKKKYSGILFALFNRYFGKFYISRKLYQIIKEEQVDVIHVHFALLRYLECIAKKIKNVRLFYTCHSLPKRYFAGKYAEEKDAAEYLIKNNNLQLIALHSDMKKELEELFQIGNVKVVNNGPDFSKYQADFDKGELRKSLNIPENAYVLGHVGRFVPLKNHVFIINVFLELLKTKPDSHLLLIGDGPEKENIIKLVDEYGIGERVHILSHRKDVHQLLKIMDGFIFPSQFEGLSIALIEAQVAGLRCVISNTVNKKTILSATTITLDLKDSYLKWCDTLLDCSIVTADFGDITEYDLRKSVKYLENLYMKGNEDKSGTIKN